MAETSDINGSLYAHQIYRHSCSPAHAGDTVVMNKHRVVSRNAV